MEREMMAHAQSLLNRSSLDVYEREEVLDRLDGLTEGEWDELQKKLQDRQIDPLARLKNGELLKASDLNIACRKAANSE